MPKSIYREEHQVLAGMLRALREEAGLTQSDLAPLLGRSQNRVSDFERGGRRVDVIEFIDYCGAVGKDPVAVFRALHKRLANRVPRTHS